MKDIKTTNTNMELQTSAAIIVEINDFIFSKDERFEWVDIYMSTDVEDIFMDQVDIDKPIKDVEDLKIFAINWFSNNVEVVKEIPNVKDETKVDLIRAFEHVIGYLNELGKDDCNNYSIEDGTLYFNAMGHNPRIICEIKISKNLL